jgi:hypothetical protein
MPSQMKEVDITTHHRPTEYVKAAIWAFIFITCVLIIAMLFWQHPMSLGAFWTDFMHDFVEVVIIYIFIASAVLGVGAAVWSHRSKVVDVGPNGTYIVSGQETIPLAPIMPDQLPTQQGVSLVTPSDKAGDYLSYVQIAGYLQSKGIEVRELQDFGPEALPEPKEETQQQFIEGLTLLQTRVLESWNRGNHGRKSIHEDLIDISERVAANTIIELETKGLIRRC